MVSRNRVYTADAHLEEKLKGYFNRLKVAFLNCGPSADLQNKIEVGLQQLVYVMQEKYHLP